MLLCYIQRCLNLLYTAIKHLPLVTATVSWHTGGHYSEVPLHTKSTLNLIWASYVQIHEKASSHKSSVGLCYVAKQIIFNKLVVATISCTINACLTKSSTEALLSRVDEQCTFLSLKFNKLSQWAKYKNIVICWLLLRNQRQIAGFGVGVGDHRVDWWWKGVMGQQNSYTITCMHP